MAIWARRTTAPPSPPTTIRAGGRATPGTARRPSRRSSRNSRSRSSASGNAEAGLDRSVARSGGDFFGDGADVEHLLRRHDVGPVDGQERRAELTAGPLHG